MNEPTKEEVLAVLKRVIDPEVGANIVDMGFIYDVKTKPGKIMILMTLSWAGCPLGSMIIGEVKNKLESKFGPKSVQVKLTFDPPWSPERMSPELRNG